LILLPEGGPDALAAVFREGGRSREVVRLVTVTQEVLDGGDLLFVVATGFAHG